MFKKKQCYKLKEKQFSKSKFSNSQKINISQFQIFKTQHLKMLNFKNDKKNEINHVLFLQIFKMLTFQNFKFFKKSHVGCPPFLFCFFRIACFCSYISQISCVCFLLNISIFQQKIQKQVQTTRTMCSVYWSWDILPLLCLSVQQDLALSL